MMKNNKPVIRFKGFSEDWEEKELGKVANFIKGRGYSKNDIVESGTPIVLYGRLYTNYQTVIEEVDTFALKQKGSVFSNGNEVIIPASGETAEDIARASAIIKSGVLLGGDLNIIYPNEEINSIFLAIAISNGQTQIELSKKAQGKSVVHLRIGDLEKVGITYPNKTEQAQIGNFFKNLDNLITLHQQKYEKLGTLKKAMLEKMFPKNGANVPEIRFKGFTGAWEEKALGEVVIFLDEQRKPLESGIRESGPYPYYGASGIIDYVKDYLFDEELILLSEDGANIIDRNYRVCFLANGKYWVNNHAHVLKSRDNYYNGFICESLERLNYDKYNTGTAQPKLNQEVCRNINVMVTSYEEQEKIGTYFKNLDDLLGLREKELAKLKNLKKALLEKMFV